MNSVILENREGTISEPHVLEHFHKTLKLKVGDRIKVTLLDEGLAEALILELTASFCRVQIGEIKKTPPAWFNLVVGLSRPQTSKKILEHATTYGALCIHFFKASLSEKSYMDAKIFNATETRAHLLSGLSQSALYCSLPQVKVDKYNPASHYLNAPNTFILDPKAKLRLSEVAIDFTRPMTLAIGPERGFIESDKEAFTQSGFTSVKVSSSILRVEHAVYSAISQLELLRKQY